MINQNWVFGTNAGLDFSTATATNPPTPRSGFAIDSGEGCASISDRNGNLLFYTDGITVWDSSHTSRLSTPLLGGTSSTQSAIIVPDPGNSNQYYVLTIGGSSTPNPSYNHFNGVLLNISNPTSWIPTPLSSLMTLPSISGWSPAEKLTAIPFKNCKGFWVITILQKGAIETGSGDGKFRVFKIDASGIVHVADTLMNIKMYEIGYLKGSPNGQRLAVANGEKVLVYPFDNATGVINIGGLVNISLPTQLDYIVPFAYGVEFSPNSNLLYYGTLSQAASGHIFQVDLTVSSPTSTLVGTIPNGGGRYVIGALQLGVDNRIYFAKDMENTLGAILNPDTIGLGCNVVNTYITLLPSLPGLPSSICQLGLPNIFPNPCEENCNCGCTGCNDNAEEQNDELIARAKKKYKRQVSNCSGIPFAENCEANAINNQVNLEPCFYYHWGDGITDQIEEHDTEVFYITVCNRFNDIQYNGVRITKITLNPNIHPIDKIQIVPDRFISLDCLEPCSCQTREFAIITRATDTAGIYSMEVEYCYESITFAAGGKKGRVKFELEITED